LCIIVEGISEQNSVVRFIETDVNTHRIEADCIVRQCAIGRAIYADAAIRIIQNGVRCESVVLAKGSAYSQARVGHHITDYSVIVRGGVDINTASRIACDIVANYGVERASNVDVYSGFRVVEAAIVGDFVVD